MAVNLGQRILVVLRMRNVHSEADTAVWLPKEHVLFSGAAAVPNRFNNTRSFVTIPEIPNATKMMKALHPETVIPGHGAPGAAKIFDDSDQYYELLLERVIEMVRGGRFLDQIKQERTAHARVGQLDGQKPISH